MKSWRTTLAAVLGIISLLATACQAQFDGDPATVANWSVIIPSIITACGLLFARDNKVTSEDAGAKPK